MNTHIPVLLHQVVEVLQPKVGEVFADVTAGYGGHSSALLHAVGVSGHAYLFDQDPQAIQALKEQFGSQQNITIAQANFADILLPVQVDMVLADLGVSSPQLDRAERGFSFSSDGPLDMRMNSSQEFSAYQIVNTYSQTALADIIYQYGEERRSRAIAKALVETRKHKPITTTAELADIVAGVVPKTSKIHPATKTFQALRIATNDELHSLERLLQAAPTWLKPGGRLAVISFHSLEDRMVKQRFAALTAPLRNQNGMIVSDPVFRKVTKKPLQGIDYDKSNPRARSAKLRAVEKIN